MICPYCGSKCRDDAPYCPECRHPLPDYVAHGRESEESNSAEYKKKSWRVFIVALCWIACILVFIFGGYKIYYWIRDYSIERQYTRGSLTPTVNQITLDDGRLGHSITFYGSDGSRVFIPELGYSTVFAGGTARLEIADSDWFAGSDLTSVESANVTISPILMTETGEQTMLPQMNFSVDAPSSPITVISPEDDSEIFTSVSTIEVEVVPGSTVTVNGEDVSNFITRDGLLTINVNVYPIGENVYTFLVQTENHRQTRQDVVITRAQHDISLELDSVPPASSSSGTLVISGKVDPGADISVDTDYIEESLYIDATTGEFEFIAELTNIGDNIVRFRAVKEGAEDTVVSFSVYYVPNVVDYTDNAWAMDYDHLALYFDVWNQRVFLCEGPVVALFEDENGQECILMDVSEEGESGDYVVLQNMTSYPNSNITIGSSYRAFADVQGRYMYENVYYPLLAVRYIYVD